MFQPLLGPRGITAAATSTAFERVGIYGGSTYRLADALIKADKEFDLVVVPGAGHGMGGAYGERRMRDFFVRHLLGVEPPNRNVERSSREVPVVEKQIGNVKEPFCPTAPEVLQ